MGAVSFAVFCLTFLPFVYGHVDDFLIMNPFIIQSGALLPLKYSLIFIFLAFIAGFNCKKEDQVYFYSGLVLFLCTAAYFAFHIYRVGYEETFMKSVGDVSYFIMCTPFLLYFLIINDRVDTAPTSSLV